MVPLGVSWSVWVALRAAARFEPLPKWGQLRVDQVLGVVFRIFFYIIAVLLVLSKLLVAWRRRDVSGVLPGVLLLMFLAYAVWSAFIAEYLRAEAVFAAAYVNAPGHRIFSHGVGLPGDRQLGKLGAPPPSPLHVLRRSVVWSQACLPHGLPSDWACLLRKRVDPIMDGPYGYGCPKSLKGTAALKSLRIPHQLVGWRFTKCWYFSTAGSAGGLPAAVSLSH